MQSRAQAAKTLACDAAGFFEEIGWPWGRAQALEILAIGERTVETHIAAIFDRFDLSSRRELSRILK